MVSASQGTTRTQSCPTPLIKSATVGSRKFSVAWVRCKKWLVTCATPTVVRVEVVIMRRMNSRALAVPFRGRRISAQPLPAAAEMMITKYAPMTWASAGPSQPAKIAAATATGSREGVEDALMLKCSCWLTEE